MSRCSLQLTFTFFVIKEFVWLSYEYLVKKGVDITCWCKIKLKLNLIEKMEYYNYNLFLGLDEINFKRASSVLIFTISGIEWKCYTDITVERKYKNSPIIEIRPNYERYKTLEKKKSTKIKSRKTGRENKLPFLDIRRH